MPEPNGTQELELAAGDKKLKIRGSDWLSLFGVAVGVLVLYMLFEHKNDSKDAIVQFTKSVDASTHVQKRMLSAQREQNCLIATPQGERERQVEFCKRIARDE